MVSVFPGWRALALSWEVRLGLPDGGPQARLCVAWAPLGWAVSVYVAVGHVPPVPATSMVPVRWATSTLPIPGPATVTLVARAALHDSTAGAASGVARKETKLGAAASFPAAFGRALRPETFLSPPLQGR